MRSINLIEPPQKILSSSVNIVSAGIITKIDLKRRAAEFCFEKIDLIKEEDNASSHEPARVDDRIKKYQTLHHAILSHKLTNGGFLIFHYLPDYFLQAGPDHIR